MRCASCQRDNPAEARFCMHCAEPLPLRCIESVFVQLVQFDGDRIVGAELFELEDLDVARARFEELRSR